METVSTLPVDEKRSRQLARVLSNVQKLSHRNSLQILEWLPAAGTKYYVEGWAVEASNGCVVFPHSWFESANRIVDPSRYRSVLYYFPAIRFDKETFARFIRDHSRDIDPAADQPFVHHSGGTALARARLRQSHKSAQLFADTLAEKMRWMRASVSCISAVEGGESDLEPAV